jgi:hypothetical protein
MHIDAGFDTERRDNDMRGVPMTDLPAGVTQEMVEAAYDAFLWKGDLTISERLFNALTAALAGRVVVPVFPTEKMTQAALDSNGRDPWDIYRAMIAATIDGDA